MLLSKGFLKYLLRLLGHSSQENKEPWKGKKMKESVSKKVLFGNGSFWFFSSFSYLR